MDWDELIEKYLDGQMSAEEEQTFASLLRSDPAFRTQLRLLEGLPRVASFAEDEAFKTTLRNIEAGHHVKKGKSRLIWAVAASLILLCGVAYFFYSPATEPSTLYTSYFEPARNVIQPNVRGDDVPTSLDRAFQRYNSGDYAAALPLFQDFYSSSHRSAILFYEGNCLLALDRPQEAIKVFEQHLTFSDELHSRSYWYLALAYIRIGDQQKALSYLDKFLDSSDTFRIEDARELKKALKE